MWRSASLASSTTDCRQFLLFRYRWPARLDIGPTTTRYSNQYMNNSCSEKFVVGDLSRQMMAQLLAVGLSPDRSVLFRQSAIAAHTQLHWILSNFTPLSHLKRMTQFKVLSLRDARSSITECLPRRKWLRWNLIRTWVCCRILSCKLPIYCYKMLIVFLLGKTNNSIWNWYVASVDRSSSSRQFSLQ